MRLVTWIVLGSLAFGVTPASAQVPARPVSDAIDEAVRIEMQKRRLPGLSLAIIQDGKIVKAKGYGVTEKGGDHAITPDTLFQAGSISKPVSALGTLLLVEKGKLALDEDVNAKLTSWKVPENAFTREKPVTLRGILSHSAGLTVHGFPGYATDGPVPSLVQVLDGEKPANTPPIRVDILPGSMMRYSGGGFTVMQQMILDVTGKAFPRFMQEAVLGPLQMKSSSFEQPQPADRAKIAATGHHASRLAVKGKWHIYPEMAAAGLWTTPSDLARFAIGVQEAASGNSAKTLSQKMVRQMLTEQKKGMGLGLFLNGSGPAMQFLHDGRDEGFDAVMIAYAETGQGAVIMVNANDNSGMVGRLLKVIAREYHWPDSTTPKPLNRKTVQVSEDTLNRYAGRYEFANNQMRAFTVDRGHLFTMSDGLADEELLSVADDRFVTSQGEVQLTFLKETDGKVGGYLRKAGASERKIPRIGPLFHALKPQADPDPVRTEKIVAALKVLAVGGPASASPAITPEALADLGSAPNRDLAGVRSAVYLAEEDVSARGIERHKNAVSRVLHYRLRTEEGDRNILIHMSADGRLTDFDIVED